MANRKFSSVPLMSAADLAAVDTIWVLDKSDTAGGPEGTVKQIASENLKPFETVKTTVAGLSLGNAALTDLAVPLLTRVATAINDQGPFTAPAGEIFNFIVYEYEYLGDPNAQDPDFTVIYTIFRLTSGRLRAGGSGQHQITASELRLDAGPYSTNPQEDASLFIELGDISVGPVEDAFNLGDGGSPYFIDGPRIITAVLDGVNTAWRFIGADGNWGGTSTSIDPLIFEAVAADFDQLTNSNVADVSTPETLPLKIADLGTAPIQLTNHEGILCNQASPHTGNLFTIGSKLLNRKAEVLIDTTGKTDFPRIKTTYSITIAGTSGTGEIDINGSGDYAVTFNTDEDTTVLDFITVNAASMLSNDGVTVTADGDIIDFSSEDYFEVSFTNLTGDLVGAINESTPVQLIKYIAFQADKQYQMYVRFNGVVVQYWFEKAFYEVVAGGDSIHLGQYETQAALETAHPTPVSNSRATINPIGTDSYAAYWDDNATPNAWVYGNIITSDSKVTPDTGTVIDMGYPLVNYCNMSSANTNTTLTLINLVNGGKSRVLYNGTIPTITGATQIKAYGVEFLPNTDIYIEIENNGTSVEYWFKEIAINPLIDLTSFPFGNIAAASSNASVDFLASAAIVKTNTGRILVSHDYNSGNNDTSGVYYSDDNGQSWVKSQDVINMFWGQLFEYNNEQYLLGTSKLNGSLNISKSTDDGITWSNPITILPKLQNGFNKSSNSIVFKDGYLLLALGERNVINFISANELVFCWGNLNDLTNPSNWGRAANLDFDGSQLPSYIYTNTSESKLPNNNGTSVPQSGMTKGYLEFNVVELNGNISIIGRLEQTPNSNYAVKLEVNWDGVTPSNTTINPNMSFIEMNGGNTKFKIVYDNISSKFWTVSNVNKYRSYSDNRTEAYLLSSSDLLTWETHEKILGYTLTSNWENQLPQLGVQYSDIIIDGNNILIATRTADENAYSFHNANLITVTEVLGFRSSVVEVYEDANLLIDENSIRIEDVNGIGIIKDQSKYFNDGFQFTAQNSNKLIWNDGLPFAGNQYLRVPHHQKLNLDDGLIIHIVVENLQDVIATRMLTKSDDSFGLASNNYFYASNIGLGVQDTRGTYSDVSVGNDYVFSSAFDASSNKLYNLLNAVNRGNPDSIVDGSFDTDHILLGTNYVIGNVSEMWIGGRQNPSLLGFNSKIKAIVFQPFTNISDLTAQANALKTKYGI